MDEDLLDVDSAAPSGSGRFSALRNHWKTLSAGLGLLLVGVAIGVAVTMAVTPAQPGGTTPNPPLPPEPPDHAVRIVELYLRVKFDSIDESKSTLTNYKQALLTMNQTAQDPALAGGLLSVDLYQRQFDAYSNQLNVVEVWRTKEALAASREKSSAHADLITAMSSNEIAPMIEKTLRGIVPDSSGHHYVLPTDLLNSGPAWSLPPAWTGSTTQSQDVYTITHVDILPTPDNIATAESLMAELMQTSSGAAGLRRFWPLQQWKLGHTGKTGGGLNHFSIVQAWDTLEHKQAYDASPEVKKVKEGLYARGGGVGGCPWEEQYHHRWG
jgi:quinol monooxygenase YgiN